MGVSGSGKTVIGKLLSKALKIPFYDADSFHPQSNIEKMASGLSLNDNDRYPWLDILSNKLKLWNTSEGAILACSALKEKYRQQLSKDGPNITWIYLDGSYGLIKHRMGRRTHHFFKPEMLKSQFDTLEVPNYGIHVDINNNKEDMLEFILSKTNNNE